MGTVRKTQNKALPKYVYRNVKRVFVRHPDGHETYLAPADATVEQIWQAYLQIDTKPAPRKPVKPEPVLTLQVLVDRFLTSPQFYERAEGTRTDARKAYKAVCGTKLSGGSFSQIGLIPADLITTVFIRQYADSRGETAKKRANAEISYLSILFGWAKERGLVKENPCFGIKKYKLAPRVRYVTDEEYDRMFALARPEVQAVMELAYLCRLRQNEVLSLTDANLRDDGLLAARGKGSKSQIIEWSPRLRAAVDLAKSIPRSKKTDRLIVSSSSGEPLSLVALKLAWQKSRLKYGEDMTWTLHDLKAKGVSDFEGDKHAASGHKTPQMTSVYDRKLDTVQSTR